MAMATKLVRDQQESENPRPPDSESSRRRRFLPWWALLGVVAVVAGFACDVFGGVETTDESWFLYVLHRVDLGQVLYRDVWVPVFPLAIWVGAAFTKVFGDHIFVLMAVDTLIFAGAVIACVSVARRIAPKSDHAALVLAVMLGWAAPGVIGPGSLYTALAYALLAATLAITLAWIDSGADAHTRRLPLLLVAAALAGLAFSSKQTIGGLALLALMATVVCSGEWRRIGPVLTTLAAVVGVFAGTVLATLIPVAVSGGLAALVRDTLTSSGARAPVGMGSAYYVASIKLLVPLLLHASPLSSWLYPATTLCAYAVPLVVIPLFLCALAVKRDIHGAVIGIFSLAALAGAIPRADYPHFIAALPFFMLALIFAWETLRPYMAPIVRAVLVVLIVIVVGARLGSIVAPPLRRHAFVVSESAHFQGAPILPEADKAARSATAELRSAPQRTVYILSFHAGFLYLASGREDVTPYDYPDITALGPSAQDFVIEAVRSGRIQAIWFDPLVLQYTGWKSSHLVAYVLTSMRPASANTPWGQLYVPSTSAQTSSAVPTSASFSESTDTSQETRY